MNRWFVNPQNPWFSRGHAFHGGIAGVNAFVYGDGRSYDHYSFRVVLLNYGLVKYLK